MRPAEVSVNADRWAHRERFHPLVIRTLWRLLRLAYHVRVSGRLPPDGPVLLAANHHHRLDAVVFATVGFSQGRLVRFLALADLWNVRVLGWVLEKGRMIPVHRGQGPFRMARDAQVALDAGQTVLIYPEGHLVPRTAGGAPAEVRAQPGAGLLALTTSAPVIPLAQWGLGKRRRTQGGRWWHRRPLAVVIGAPFDRSRWSGRSDQAASQEAADALLGEIRALIGAAERLALRGPPGSAVS